MTADPESPEPFQVDFDITVIDGEPGRRLAALQADAILNVLTWFRQHAQLSHWPPTTEAAASRQPPAGGRRWRLIPSPGGGWIEPTAPTASHRTDPPGHRPADTGAPPHHSGRTPNDMYVTIAHGPHLPTTVYGPIDDRHPPAAVGPAQTAITVPLHAAGAASDISSVLPRISRISHRRVHEETSERTTMYRH